MTQSGLPTGFGQCPEGPSHLVAETLVILGSGVVDVVVVVGAAVVVVVVGIKVVPTFIEVD